MAAGGPNVAIGGPNVVTGGPNKAAEEPNVTEGKKKLELVRHSVLSLVLHGKSVPLHLLYARYHF